jgi:hypothetical protein
VLTGESLPAEKLPGSFRLARRWAELSCRALMGTVGTPVPAPQWQPPPEEGRSPGGSLPGLGEHQPETGFQAGLHDFSMILEPPPTAVRLAQRPR